MLCLYFSFIYFIYKLKILYYIAREIIYAHETVVCRYARDNGGTIIGIVVAPSMRSFAKGAFEAAADTEAGNIVLLTDINNLSLYILHVILYEWHGRPFEYFCLP